MNEIDRINYIREGKSLLDGDYITQEEFDCIKKNLMLDKPVIPQASTEEIRTAKALIGKGLNEEDYFQIKTTYIAGRPIINTADITTYWNLLTTGIINEEEFKGFKEIIFSGGKLPPIEKIEGLIDYKRLLDKGLISYEDYELFKANAFAGKEVIGVDKLNSLEEYKQLLLDGVLDEEEYEKYKESLLPSAPLRPFVFPNVTSATSSTEQSEKLTNGKAKDKKKTIITIAVVVAVVAIAAFVAIGHMLNTGSDLTDVSESSNGSAKDASSEIIVLSKSDKNPRVADGYEIVEVGQFSFSVPTYFTDDPGTTNPLTYYAERGIGTVMLQLKEDDYGDYDFEDEYVRTQLVEGFISGVKEVSEKYSSIGEFYTFRTSEGLVGVTIPYSYIYVREDGTEVNTFGDYILIQNPDDKKIACITTTQSEYAEYDYSDAIKEIINSMTVHS